MFIVESRPRWGRWSAALLQCGGTALLDPSPHNTSATFSKEFQKEFSKEFQEKFRKEFQKEFQKEFP